MERRKALAYALTGAVLLVSGVLLAMTLVRSEQGTPTAVPLPVAAAADAPGVTVATEPTTTLATEVVTEVQVVEDQIVVPRPAAGASPGAVTAADGGDATGPSAAAPTAAAPAPAAVPTTSPAPAPAPTAAPTTTRPSTTTTTRPTTTTSSLPPGVPKDWPVGKPIPPMPAGCIDGQLEDNGVWNCQH